MGQTNTNQTFIHLLLLGTCIGILEASESRLGCGKVDKALVGKDPRVEAPWTATLLYQSTFKCGEFRPSGYGHGIIIGPQTILTSGVFLWGDTQDAETARLLPFNASNFVVAVGLKSRQPFAADQFTQFIKISEIRVNPKSYERYSNNDFVILHLSNPIRYSSYVRPVCLDTSPELAIENASSTEKFEDLSISGYNRGVAETQPFGFLDPAICKQKLSSEFREAPQTGDILRLGLPCGFSSPSREDVRSWSGYGNALIQERFLTVPLPQRNKRIRDPVLPNLCFQKGSGIVARYNDRWHLVGWTAESLGVNCKSNNLYFTSFVTHKDNMNWITRNIIHGTNTFVCNDGETVEKFRMCNDFKDCGDESDEDRNYCEAIRCNLFSSYCKKCEDQDTLQILGKSYKYSNATNSDEIKCPGLLPPDNSFLHCENPVIKKRITCAYGSDPGTRAVFQCKTGKPNEPATFCVVTCKDDGKWTDELKGFVCNGTRGTDLGFASNLIFSPNGTDHWINNILLHPSSRAQHYDPSLDDWMPPQISTPDILDKGGPRKQGKCPGFKSKPGLKITCRSPGSVISKCSKDVDPGTKAEFTCEPYYRPIFSAASMIKTCQTNGRWSLESRVFECRLDCGVPKQNLVGHIVNGQLTSGLKWPWHAIIFRKTKDGSLAYICGATLISRRLLLTAAHCVTDRAGNVLPASDFLVLLGATSNSLEENYGDPHTQIVKVDNVTANQAFNPNTFESDIAFVRISGLANITDFIRPACFPTTITLHNELVHLSPGSKGHIVGFGYDESGTPSRKLREATLPVVSYSECYQVVKVQASSAMYCAGYTNGTAACNGDSGGGMFFEDDSYPRRMYLQGIVSHGNRDESTGLCDKNQYSIFTKVSAFKHWINQVGLELDDDF